MVAVMVAWFDDEVWPEHGHREEFEDQCLDELGLKNVSQGDPVEELQQGI